MEFKVTYDQTKRNVQLRITDGPGFEPHDQNRYRRRQIKGRADTLVILAEVETVNGAVGSIIVESAKLLGPQLKADGSHSETLRCSATWSDSSYTANKISDMPGWLWEVVRDALTGSIEYTAEDPLVTVDT